MELGPRDRLSQAFVHEVEKGRTIDTPYGPVVHLDLRHLGAKLIDSKLPFVRELCLKYERIDPVTELIPVRPVVHYMMGGVHTDIDGATPLAGLYAAGETACVSINGANRLGSNSLPECLVFGARAGRAAAEYAARRRAASRAVDHRAGGRRGAPARARRCWARSRGTSRSPAIRDEMQADDGGRPPGSTAPEPALAKGADTLPELQERVGVGRARGPQPDVQHRAGRPRWSWPTCSTSPSASSRRALQREESRGAHQRTDFPARDDERFLTHHLMHPQTPTATPQVEHLPVTITRWPPGERVYGR